MMQELHLATLFFGGVAALFFIHTGSALYHLRWVHRLPAASPDASEAPVRVSVIIAARDEEARIEQTVRHILAQVAVDLDVIIVDDRSRDGTAAILAKLAAEDARVRVIRVDTLPAQWLGKTYACYLGANQAEGEWLLFTDADCWLKPDVLLRAATVARREGADHVTLTPGIVPASIGAAAWHLAFLTSLTNWISAVNRNRPKGYLGMGAFNFVRAASYRDCGGYQALQLTVLDDVKLGLLLRRAGKRTRAFIGGDDTQCHWGTTARAMLRIMEKNYFAALDYNTVAAFVLGVGGIIIWSAAILGAFAGTAAGYASVASVLAVSLPAAAIASRLGWGMVTALAAPFIYPFVFYAVLNSTLVTLRQGGIRWRDTFYPLQMLRERNVR